MADDSRSSAARAAGVFVLAVIVAAGTLVGAAPPDWARFRGPNGSGISAATGVPTEFGPSKNLAWRTPLPQGHSSPILFEDRIYLTGLRDNALVTLAIDRHKDKSRNKTSV